MSTADIIESCAGLNTEHTALIQQFRSNLSDVLLPTHDDLYLLKWLKARKFNLNDAEKMLRDHFEFREKWKVDYIANEWEPPEVLKLYMPSGEYGFDIDGHPVFYQILGTLDTRGILHSASRQDIMRYTIRICENIQRATQEQRSKLGRPIESITLIVDMGNVGLQIIWRPFLDVYSEMLKMFEANYPETLHVCLAVNASYIFKTAYSFIKPFLSEDTKKKITVAGANYRELLSRVIADDQLPEYYGGSAKGVDGCPKCGICFGGKIPTSYYLKNEISQDKFQSVIIPRGLAIRFTYDVSEKGTVLSWVFMTGKDDIEFSVQYKETRDETDDNMNSNNPAKPIQQEDKSTPVIYRKRICSPIVPEHGSVICEDLGIYTIEFNNSYSWFRSKKVLYFVDVLMPEVEEKR